VDAERVVWVGIDERLAERLVEEMSEDFGVEKPKVKLVDAETVERVCGKPVFGCYDLDERAVVADKGKAGVRTIVHEFAHHLQFADVGWDKNAMVGRTLGKRHEDEAYAFADAFEGFYARRLEGIREGKPRADGRLACGHLVAQIAENLHAAARKAERGVAGGAIEAAEKAGNLAWVLPWACGVEKGKAEELRKSIDGAIWVLGFGRTWAAADSLETILSNLKDAFSRL
jgi:hypothetical protein